MRESFKILGENLEEFLGYARAGCFGDGAWFMDAYQQLWVEVAFLEERRERTGNSMGLHQYLAVNMRDRIRMFYEQASNVVQPPINPRDLARKDKYSNYVKRASEAAQRSKGYTSYDSFEGLM